MEIAELSAGLRALAIVDSEEPCLLRARLGTKPAFTSHRSPRPPQTLAVLRKNSIGPDAGTVKKPLIITTVKLSCR